jgi:transposase-like protein
VTELGQQGSKSEFGYKLHSLIDTDYQFIRQFDTTTAAVIKRVFHSGHFMVTILVRVHKEIKRRTKKVGACTDSSLLRLAVSILIDINEEWITDNRYLSVKSE